MINRLILATATAAAVVVVVTPAAIGLRGTSSFTQNIPVPVPSDAHRIRSDDPVLVRESAGSASSTASPRPGRSVSVSPEIERHGTRTRGVDDGDRSGSAVGSESTERHSGADDRPVHSASGASSGRGSGGGGSSGGGSDDGSGGRSHSGGHG